MGFAAVKLVLDFLEVRSREGEQESISKGFLLPVGRQMRIN